MREPLSPVAFMKMMAGQEVKLLPYQRRLLEAMQAGKPFRVVLGPRGLRITGDLPKGCTVVRPKPTADES